MIENLNLLNKMNEGLIVISEKERTIKFASQPAVRLLKRKPMFKDSSDDHKKD